MQLCVIMFDCFQYLREHHEMIILSLFDRASLGWGISRSSMIASTRRFLVSNRASRESADQVWKHSLEVSLNRIGQIAFLQSDSLPWLEFIPSTWRWIWGILLVDKQMDVLTSTPSILYSSQVELKLLSHSIGWEHSRTGRGRWSNNLLHYFY